MGRNGAVLGIGMRGGVIAFLNLCIRDGCVWVAGLLFLEGADIMAEFGLHNCLAGLLEYLAGLLKPLAQLHLLLAGRLLHFAVIHLTLPKDFWTLPHYFYTF